MDRAQTTTTISAPVAAVRLRSLDALRGFDMFWIVSGEFIFHGIASVIKQRHGLVQDPSNWQIQTTEALSFTENIFVGISNQLHHTVWNGFTFYDLIFPLFIFIAGVSMPYSMGKQLEKAGGNKAAVRRKIVRSLLKRTIILLLLGMVANGALQLNGYEHTRFASVLGRIAISCFFAALISLYCSLKGQLLWFAGLLLGYWAMLTWIPVPGFGAGVLTPEGNFAAYIDRLLLPGKLHRKVYDPEGLLSNIPAIASALLGVFAGTFLKNNKLTPARNAGSLAIAGLALVSIGYGWGLFFPINKNMWTSSFTLYAGGWSMLLFALFYYIIDVAGIARWAAPFTWMGMNSILIYMAAHGLVNFETTSDFLFGGVISKFPPEWYTALLWTGVAILQFVGMYFLYKKKLFVKL
ncbi:MAG: acyltransferase family protein [Chitinophagaceae bacterium]